MFDEGGPAGAQRVLVVDDHPDTTEVLAVFFRLLGHETQCALRGRDALKIARAFDPDLVLLDIGLPDISGYEVARALRADRYRPNRFIAALSGWGPNTDGGRALSAGVDEYLVKPVSLANIRHILRLSANSVASSYARATGT